MEFVRIPGAPASELAREWVTHAEASRIALSRRPDDVRSPYLLINLKVLKYLLERYGREAGLDKEVVPEPARLGIQTMAGIPESPRAPRGASDIAGLLEGIATAAEGQGDYGMDDPSHDPPEYRWFPRMLVVLLILLGAAALGSGVAGVIDEFSNPRPPTGMTCTIPAGPDVARAQAMYEKGHRLVRQNKGAEAKGVFERCIFHYGDTRYMNLRLPPSGKTRLEIIQDLLRRSGP